ncbi:dihydrofolate reductase [Halococcoides cellulosivorans]|uniref:dihydrofolate reductase n=1 Tax=Halococcoides cellulosivorans TaxID=1679096 RepID=A0A2R4X0U7_9EURY|nr:dihydrofolate reductase [Halococcoides cellulosivorans]AWB27424.1 dihydrofolate reductase [Halococcoides cellulosivorans]
MADRSDADPELVAVAAVAENGVIGDGPTLPWDLPHEVERYRARVADATVAIGRRTFEMFENPPGAHQIVLSRSERTSSEATTEFVTSVDAAVAAARDRGAETLYVLGGAAIYEAFLPECDRLLISRIDGTYDGDASFPEIGADWTLTEKTRHEGYTLETYRPA